MISVSGSFDVILNSGHEQTTVTLNKPNQGLYIPPMVWREMGNFSSGSVCLVLSSMPYDENEYIRDYEDFLRGTYEK